MDGSSVQAAEVEKVGAALYLLFELRRRAAAQHRAVMKHDNVIAFFRLIQVAVEEFRFKGSVSLPCESESDSPVGNPDGGQAAVVRYALLESLG